MDFKEVIDEIISKVSPELVKSAGSLSVEGYKKLANFFKKKFAKQEAVKQLSSPTETVVKREDAASLHLEVLKKYEEDKDFKAALDKILHNTYKQENRTIVQKGRNSVYIENASGEIHFN